MSEPVRRPADQSDEPPEPDPLTELRAAVEMSRREQSQPNDDGDDYLPPPLRRVPTPKPSAAEIVARWRDNGWRA